MAISKEAIRKARAYLQRRGLKTADVNPKDFAEMAASMGKPFSEILEFIAHIKMAGRGESPFYETTRTLTKQQIRKQSPRKQTKVS